MIRVYVACAMIAFRLRRERRATALHYAPRHGTGS